MLPKNPSIQDGALKIQSIEDWCFSKSNPLKFGAQDRLIKGAVLPNPQWSRQVVEPEFLPKGLRSA